MIEKHASTVDDPRYLPQVILAGAPKCGTTSIFEYLKDHPQICASSVKETDYLIDKNYPLYRETANIATGGWVGYKRFFSHCSGESAGFRLEATPDYLYQRTPLETIPSWPITPKVIFVLRRPEDRVFSLYRFAQNNLGILGKDVSFNQFLGMLGSKDSPIFDRYILNNAIAHSRYVDYLLGWRLAIGSKNIRIFLLEDFRENRGGFMKDIATHLGIDSSFYENYDFQIKNKSYNVKNQRVHRWKRAVSPYVKSKAIRSFLSGIYQSTNISDLPKLARYEKSEIDQLALQFDDSNRRLEVEFGLDLTCWGDRNEV
jgi:hypothetical protein